MLAQTRATVKAVRLRMQLHGLNDVAAGLSFWVFLSIFPTLIALSSLLGALDLIVGQERAQAIRDGAKDLVQEYITGDNAAEIQQRILDILDYRNTGLAVVAFATALYSMSKGFSGLCRALALVNADPQKRAGWRGKIVGMLLGAVTLAVLVVLLAQSAIGPLFGFESSLPRSGEIALRVWEIARIPVLLGLLIAWTAVLLKVGAGLEGRWRAVLPGALLTTTLWALVTIGTALAVRLGLLKANPLFGALGAVLLFLTWLKLMSNAILLGAELNAHRHGRPLDIRLVPPEPAPPPAPAVPGETFGQWVLRVARGGARP